MYVIVVYVFKTTNKYEQKNALIDCNNLRQTYNKAVK